MLFCIGAMAFLGTAARRAMACRRPLSPLSPLCRVTARCYSSQSTHTTEKSVPYEKTLKQEDGLSGPTKPLPKSADVVVIGGGSLGCQTLYHLCKMGMSNVVLLERDRLTAGTTWHTAGIQKILKWFLIYNIFYRHYCFLCQDKATTVLFSESRFISFNTCSLSLAVYWINRLSELIVSLESQPSQSPFGLAETQMSFNSS